MKEIICLSLFLLVAGCAGKVADTVSDADRNTGLADQAAKRVIASVTNMTRREGEADSEDQLYKLKLSTKPTGNVIVTPSSSDLGTATVAYSGEPEGLTFTTNNWSEEQPVRVRPVNDEDADEENVTIEHKVSDGGYDEVTGPNVIVTVNDDDRDIAPMFHQSVQVENQSYIKGTEIDLRLPAATGGNGPLSYSLSDSNGNLPMGLSFNGSRQQLSGTPAEAQEATIYTYTATDADRNTRPNDESTLTFTIKVTAKRVIASVTDMTRKESEADSEDQIYKLKLSTKPTGNVIVTPSSSDLGAATVAYSGEPEGLTFTTNNWSEEQPVRVRPVNDINFDEEKVTIEHEASGGGYNEVTSPNVIVTVNDDIASFAIPGIENPVEVNKLEGIIVVVGIIITVGIVMWYKGEIIGYIVKGAGYSRIVIKERKNDFILGVILLILANVLGFAGKNLSCK